MSTIRRLLVPLGVAAAALVGPSPTAGADPIEVHISQHRYEPATIVVEPGATVRWINEDEDPHTVTSDAGAFASAGLDTHEEWTFTFAAPGTYPYHCALHPTMHGAVVVR